MVRHDAVGPCRREWQHSPALPRTLRRCCVTTDSVIMHDTARQIRVRSGLHTGAIRSALIASPHPVVTGVPHPPVTLGVALRLPAAR
jgi:hypothetical protein